ncbi:MAG: hypothetical protein WC391_05760 [Methanoregula sp.]|jgi:hypothetical protein
MGRGFQKRTGRTYAGKGSAGIPVLGRFLSREILSITGITITGNGEQQKGVRFRIPVPNGAFRFAEQETISVY